MSMDYGCGDNSCVFGSPGGMATNGGCRCFEEMARTPEGRQARRNLQKGIYFMRQKLARYDEAIRLLRECVEWSGQEDIPGLNWIDCQIDRDTISEALAFLATEPKGDNE